MLKISIPIKTDVKKNQKSQITPTRTTSIHFRQTDGAIYNRAVPSANVAVQKLPHNMTTR